MDWKAHIALGLICSAGLIAVLAYFSISYEISLITAGIAVLYSILPDIDNKNSAITHLFQVVLLITAVYFALQLFQNNGDLQAILGLAGTVGIYVFHFFYSKDGRDHRRFPHTFLFGIIAVGLCYFITKSWVDCGVAAVSFLSHLVGDLHFALR